MGFDIELACENLPCLFSRLKPLAQIQERHDEGREKRGLVGETEEDCLFFIIT